ncbi:MAG: tRNA threonylcarbamoyladenosine dehydratase [Treponema sp.]|nr:tRNA threonylcarbamoyladenosine dehydratase [Treponema sp.]MBQ6567181.1 tRNA threonylcarbamoyladenosine dehydratase [Treponema sp.]
MADERFSRLALLAGNDALDRLASSRVAVFGVGGVGGYVCEALARSGVGSFLIVDDDVVSLSNINRQIIATERTLGMYKVDVMADRMRDINPAVRVDARRLFFSEENKGEFDLASCDYVVDAIDSVPSKVALILHAQSSGTRIISSMGAGNKLEANRFKVADIYETAVCPLARVMRQRLKKAGVAALKVVYSDEPPLHVPAPADGSRAVPGSTAFVPPAAGLLIAGEVVRDLLGLPSAGSRSPMR